MRWLENTSLLSKNRIPRYLLGFGTGLAFVLLCEIVLVFSADPRSVDKASFLAGAVTTVPFLVGIAYAGYWLRSSALSTSRYPRIAGWCLGGLAAFLFINLVLIVTMPVESWTIAASWIRWAVAFGAGIGLLIGCLEGRAIERALTAERAALRTEHLEEQRDYLDYLNGILRHEVLNTATVINGYASQVLEEESTLDDCSREWLEIVIDHSEDMSTVIDDVRVLLQTRDGTPRLEPVNATRVLAAELRNLENERDGVEVVTSIPPDVFVLADDLLPRVFGNLLSNAVEHNDAVTPRITVTVEPGPDTVRFEIADNGSGIPESEIDSLFDRVESRGSTHGLGLYLVDQLVARYDGTVELAETGPDGSRFVIDLPVASLGRDDGSSDERPRVALASE
ncbi:sensor histidine kinase [Natrinema longum]|uniref:histidine kinase n=1 Tax=Natrinema longum TaxID=370324 RepID=A0A8A2UDS0_9EURY|nr:HAMP domain-containing sensor histidine kinase [Natrinema longum]MBZ6495137.1 HAMP domain-containing histidine kinase [Natrinema longum]QSW86879.1 HAMP domain-containing histidine kinase [Natrinema longum]